MRVSADVKIVGSVALVSFHNGSSRRVAFIVSGLEGPAQRVTLRGNDRYRSVFTVAGDLTVALADGSILYPQPASTGVTMASRTSGRFSRFPAVNREASPAEPEADVFAPPAPAPDAPEIPASADDVAAALLAGDVSVETVALSAEDLAELDGLNVADTVAWAGEDPVKRAAVLAREQASEKPRKGVLSALA